MVMVGTESNQRQSVMLGQHPPTLCLTHISSPPGGRGTVVNIATFTFIPPVRRWNLCVTVRCMLFSICISTRKLNGPDE